MKYFYVLIFPIFIIIFSNCIVLKENNTSNAKNIASSYTKKIKLTIYMQGCFPDDINTCKYSRENYELLNKTFAKSGLISQINGNINNLNNSDFVLDLYWEEKDSRHEIITNIISTFTLLFIPTYNRKEVKLIAVIKKNNGEILETFEYKETYLTIRQIALILALPFQDLNDEEIIKIDILKLLLYDLSKIQK